MKMTVQLLPVEPLGIGSSEIESISSFFVRLSVVNGASPKKILEWIGKKNGISELVPSIASSAPINLVRPTKLNAKFLSALSQSTGVDVNILGRMTYHSLDLVVNRHQGCFDKRFRWCPACIYETANMNHPTHFRLYWSLTGFNNCPIHHTPLQTRCPVCGSYQDSWRNRDALDVCVSCGTTLGYSYLHPELITAAGMVSQQAPEAPDLILLTKFISEGNSHALKPDGPRKALYEAFDYAWNRNEELEYFKKLPRDECLAYLHCNKPITITTARRLAFRTGVPLVDLLCGSTKECTRELDANWRDELPDSLKPQKRKPYIDVEHAQEAIKQALKDPQRPSLRDFSQQIGISTGGLSYYFYDQCTLISKRYKQRLVEEKMEKKDAAAKAVRDAIFQWQKERIDPPSHKGLLKLLFPSSGLPKHVLRATIARSLDVKTKV
ncbi:MAG: hypothetical protein C0631_16570 [Sedimenticola sp.]|nr:MAG: hypothetical protein C0631_16570 [Sedimenticola sp.]